MADSNLNTRIKKCIIERLNLEVTPEEIDDSAPIFTAEGDTPEGSMSLDSIDALELVVALGNEFGVTITDDDITIFESINTIAAYVKENGDPELVAAPQA
jgi:acyl carrier protein